MPSDAITPEMVKAFQRKYREFWKGSWPDAETSRELIAAAMEAAEAGSEAFRSALVHGAVEAEPVAWVTRGAGRRFVRYTPPEPHEVTWRPVYYASPPEELERVKRERDDARDLTWFWEIVDREGLADVPSDEKAALALLCRRASDQQAMLHNSKVTCPQSPARALAAESQLAEARAQLAALSREGGR